MSERSAGHCRDERERAREHVAKEIHMPLYAYRCGTCGAEQDAYLPVAEVDTGAPECTGHGTMRQYLTPVMVSVQAECHFICSATDQPVTSHRQRQNIMAEHNLIDARELDYGKRISERKAQKARDLEDARATLPPVDLTEYIPAAPV
jgi:predicted nucleic acid-binding Zn ribbon protein